VHTGRSLTENTISEAVKGKVVPLQAWSGPEGYRKLRFPDFITTAQDDGKDFSLTHRPPLPPGNIPGTHFCYRLRPDAVLIQFDLLMMSTELLETCRGLK